MGKKKSKTIEINVGDLITNVETYTAIYDPMNPFHRDANRISNMWKEIGKSVGASGAQCKEKWRGLRDSYVRKKRELKGKSGQAAKRIEKWQYMESLRFLDGYVKGRETRSNCEYENLDSESDQVTDEEEVEEPEKEHEQAEDLSMQAEEKKEATLPTPLKKTKGKEAKEDKVGQAMLEYMSNKKEQQQQQQEQLQRQQQQNQQTPKDEDELFALSIIPTLKRLPSQNKALAKLKIQELLYQLEFTMGTANNVQYVQYQTYNQPVATTSFQC